MLPKTRIVEGIEVSTSEYFNAIRAVNFISTYGFSYTIKLSDLSYDLDTMLEHARQLVSERGYQELLIDRSTKGFIELHIRK